MKQMLFETRQKAEELLKEALAIWRQSDQADYLEGIEKDPVFSMLMMALAYQSNELDSEVERLKSEVLEDFARQMIPYEMGHATPATAVIETGLQDSVADYRLGEGCIFQLSDHPFIPLLATRVLNAGIRSIVRMDGRRWKVSLSFKHPVSDLSLFAFAIRNTNFRNVAVSVKGKLLPLVKPWHYSELPLTDCFSPESMSYNKGQMRRLSSLPLDLFARQNIRMFIIEPHNPLQFLPSEVDHLDLIFEFSGIPDDFRFDKTLLSLNPVVLVNAQNKEATLTASKVVVMVFRSGRVISGKNSALMTYWNSLPSSSRSGVLEVIDVSRVVSCLSSFRAASADLRINCSWAAARMPGPNCASRILAGIFPGRKPGTFTCLPYSILAARQYFAVVSGPAVTVISATHGAVSLTAN